MPDPRGEQLATNKELLILHITTIVPFMIFDLIQQGGITEQHMREARSYVETIASEGDAILYSSKQKGKSGRAIDRALSKSRPRCIISWRHQIHGSPFRRKQRTRFY
jgi:hypothetical protein